MVNVVGFIQKVLVGSNNPKWKIFWEGLILNCPGVTQNFGGVFTKILLQFLFALLTLNMIRLLKKYRYQGLDI